MDIEMEIQKKPKKKSKSEKNKLKKKKKSKKRSVFEGLDLETHPCQVDLSNIIPIALEELKNITHLAEVLTKKKTEEQYIYGNYRDYYIIHRNYPKYEDQRLKMIVLEWIKGKQCLDIGCNSGEFTLELVCRFYPMKMIGIDLDLELIKLAQNKLKDAIKNAEKNINIKGDIIEMNKRVLYNKSLNNTNFICNNIMDMDIIDIGHYDMVLCLSVTKWIHFHKGDMGIKYLFKKIYDILNPNGYFLLEPQSYENYKKAIKRNKTLANAPIQLNDMKFTPEKFVDYLVNEIGLKVKENLFYNIGESGFNRPMYLFQKTNY